VPVDVPVPVPDPVPVPFAPKIDRLENTVVHNCVLSCAVTDNPA
jgi:hypothetical protein